MQQISTSVRFLNFYADLIRIKWSSWRISNAPGGCKYQNRSTVPLFATLPPGLSKYIDEIHSKAVKESREREVLSKKLSNVEGDLKQEMEKEITRLKTDHENKMRDQLEKLSLESNNLILNT